MKGAVHLKFVHRCLRRYVSEIEAATNMLLHCNRMSMIEPSFFSVGLCGFSTQADWPKSWGTWAPRIRAFRCRGLSHPREMNEATWLQAFLTPQ